VLKYVAVPKVSLAAQQISADGQRGENKRDTKVIVEASVQSAETTLAVHVSSWAPGACLDIRNWSLVVSSHFASQLCLEFHEFEGSCSRWLELFVLPLRFWRLEHTSNERSYSTGAGAGDQEATQGMKIGILAAHVSQSDWRDAKSLLVLFIINVSNVAVGRH
jgi:hypothetical protein